MGTIAVAALCLATGCSDDGEATSGSGSGSAGTGMTSAGAGPDTAASTSAGTTVDPTTTSSGGQTGGETTGPPPLPNAASLQFFGNGGTFDDRVLVRLDDPMTNEPGPPIDVGAGDFTIEFWIRPDPAGNANPAVNCGDTNDWVTSNIIIDRDRHSVAPSFGVGIAGGTMLFAVQGPAGDPHTMCGTAGVLDDAWHHVAVQRRRSDGFLWLYVDGVLDASVDGPDGDVSYPDDGVPMDVCPGGLCDYSDPFLVFGAEKHGYGGISYAGWLDEVRVSDALRYDTDFVVPTQAFVSDGNTVGLFHFEQGIGDSALDDSPNRSHGTIRFGGDPPGPVWATDTPF